MQKKHGLRPAPRIDPGSLLKFTNVHPETNSKALKVRPPGAPHISASLRYDPLKRSLQYLFELFAPVSFVDFRPGAKEVSPFYFP